jgi:predicted HTH domain antitoxin
MELTLEIPDQYLDGTDANELAQRIKLYVAVLLYQLQRLSAGAAAEFAEVDRYTFMVEAGRHGVPAISYPASELADEVERLRRADR